MDLRREKIDIFLATLKNKPCLDCHKKFHPWVMDFDHVKRGKKDDINGLRRLRAPVDIVKKEVSKCELVCSNCHRLRTFKRLLRKSKKLQRLFG